MKWVPLELILFSTAIYYFIENELKNKKQLNCYRRQSYLKMFPIPREVTWRNERLVSASRAAGAN